MGASASEAVHNAVVLEEIAHMALLTERIARKYILPAVPSEISIITENMEKGLIRGNKPFCPFQ